MSTLPYPPPYQDIDVLCAHLCISPSTVEAWMRVRNRVIEALREAGRPLEVKDIQLAAGLCTRNAADILLGKMARDSEITRVGRGRYALPTVHSGQIEQKERFESQGVELTAEITDLSNLSDPSDGDAEFPGPRPLMGATVPPTAPAEAKSNGRAPPLGPPGDSLDDFQWP